MEKIEASRIHRIIGLDGWNDPTLDLPTKKSLLHWSGGVGLSASLDALLVPPTTSVDTVEFGLDVIGLNTGPEYVSNIQASRTTSRYHVPRNGLYIFPSGFSWKGSHLSDVRGQYVRDLSLKMDLRQLARPPWSDNPGKIEPLTPAVGLVDAQLTRLMLNLNEEVSSGCIGGASYIETICMAVYQRLHALQSGAIELIDPPQSYCFSPSQRKLLEEYIAVHITEDLSLITLAELVNTSINVFFRLFRNTFSITPHRFIVRQKILAAGQLLQKGQTAASVSELLRFSSPSHFGGLFSKIMGVTPRMYAKGLRGLLDK